MWHLMKNESKGRTPLCSVIMWIDCEFLVLKLWRLSHTKGDAWSAKFQRYEIWACKRLPCILYSGHTCVLMDIAPANHCNLKWLSMQVAVLPSLSLNSSKCLLSGSFGVHLDFLLWKFLCDLKWCFWSFSSTHFVILLVCSFHVLVDSTSLHNP